MKITRHGLEKNVGKQVFLYRASAELEGILRKDGSGYYLEACTDSARSDIQLEDGDGLGLVRESDRSLLIYDVEL